MEYRDTKTAGGPPDDPPPYSAVPPDPTLPSGHRVVPSAVPMRPVIHTVVVNQMGPTPAHIVCKSCNHQIVTRVEAKPTMRTHLFALIICLIGCWPFVCLPYCMDSCNNADHYCPNCNSYIGSYFN